MRRYWSNDIDDVTIVTNITLGTNTNVAYLVVPFTGVLKSASSVVHGTTDTDDEVLTVSIAGTTAGTITIANASSAGDIDDIVVSGPVSIVEGEVIKVATDGANGQGVVSSLTFVFDQSL